MFALLIDGGTVKAGKAAELTSIYSSQIVPTLKKQEGFLDAVMLIGTGSPEGISLTFWDTQQHVEQYKTRTFQENYSKVKHLIDGTPKLRTFEVKHAGDLRIKSREAA